MNSVMEQRRDGFLDDLAAQVTATLKELNIDESKAEIAAAEVSAKVVSNYGGQQLYIPKDYAHKSQDRALAIYEACNGRNFPEVATQFDISERSVYRIHKRIRAQIIAQNQSDMFNSP
ncbi:MAG: Mor transcription activator family protein [Cellvibrio sp.]